MVNLAECAARIATHNVDTAQATRWGWRHGTGSRRRAMMSHVAGVFAALGAGLALTPWAQLAPAN